MSGAVFPACFLLPFLSLFAAQNDGTQMPGKPEPALVAAQTLVDAGKLDEAAGAVRRYIEQNESSADGHYLLGYILFRQTNPKASLEEYRKGAMYRAPSALDFEVMGCDYFLLEDYTAADEWLTKSVELNPKEERARYYLGRTKYNEKRFDDAVREFTECLKL